MRAVAAVISAASLLLLSSAGRAGQQLGVQSMLGVSIDFTNQAGTTVADALGVHYSFGGQGYSETKIYPQAYWGTYPLYFFETTVGIQVHVSNPGPWDKAKVRIVTTAAVLNLDGTSGFVLSAPKTIDVVVSKGETKTVDASFFAQYSPQAESGLDLLTVQVLHPNDGGGPGNLSPALIETKQAVFCPPKYSGPH